MKFIKLFFLLNATLLSGCLIERSSQPKSDIIKLDFRTINNEYFKIYKPEVFDVINKPETQYMSIDIGKKNMSLSDFNNLEKKLTIEGWVKVDENNGLYRYCYSEYQSLTFLYPTLKNHYDSKGDIYNFDNYSNWAIEVYFNKYGVDNCIGKL